MMSRREKYVAGLGAAAIVVLAGLIVAGSILSRRIEPYIRQQAEQYLRTRFHAEVRIASLHVRLPKLSPLGMLFTRGRGTIALSTARRSASPPPGTIPSAMAAFVALMASSKASRRLFISASEGAPTRM